MKLPNRDRASTRALKKHIGTTALALVIITGFYVSSRISQNDIELITTKLGWTGPVVIGLYILVTQIIAPLSGTAGIFVGIKLYGYGPTLAILYFVSMISAVSNFWIARRYGRNAVKKFVGIETMREIDEIARANDHTLLVTSRIFGYYLFDIISFAVGLTEIPFKKYYYYTVILTIIPVLAQYFIFRNIDFNTFTGMAIYFGSLLLTGVLFTRFFYRAFIKPRTKKILFETSALDGD